jgi:hypothetical protein
VDEEIRKGASFPQKINQRRASPEEPKRKDAPEVETNVISLQERAKLEAKSYLEQLLSEGARKLLQAAIENEVSEYLQGHRDQRSELGERSVVSNGHVPERDLVTGVGPVKDSAAAGTASRWGKFFQPDPA